MSNTSCLSSSSISSSSSPPSHPSYHCYTGMTVQSRNMSNASRYNAAPSMMQTIATARPTCVNTHLVATSNSDNKSKKASSVSLEEYRALNCPPDQHEHQEDSKKKKRRLFHHDQVVKIISHSEAAYNGQRGTIARIPVHPSTWYSVIMNNGKTIYACSPNFEVVEIEQEDKQLLSSSSVRQQNGYSASFSPNLCSQKLLNTSAQPHSEQSKQKLDCLKLQLTQMQLKRMQNLRSLQKSIEAQVPYLSAAFQPVVTSQSALQLLTVASATRVTHPSSSPVVEKNAKKKLNRDTAVGTNAHIKAKSDAKTKTKIKITSKPKVSMYQAGPAKERLNNLVSHCMRSWDRSCQKRLHDSPNTMEEAKEFITSMLRQAQCKMSVNRPHAGQKIDTNQCYEETDCGVVQHIVDCCYLNIGTVGMLESVFMDMWNRKTALRRPSPTASLSVVAELPKSAIVSHGYGNISSVPSNPDLQLDPEASAPGITNKRSSTTSICSSACATIVVEASDSSAPSTVTVNTNNLISRIDSSQQELLTSDALYMSFSHLEADFGQDLNMQLNSVSNSFSQEVGNYYSRPNGGIGWPLSTDQSVCAEVTYNKMNNTTFENGKIVCDAIHKNFDLGRINGAPLDAAVRYRNQETGLGNSSAAVGTCMAQSGLNTPNKMLSPRALDADAHLYALPLMCSGFNSPFTMTPRGDSPFCLESTLNAQSHSNSFFPITPSFRYSKPSHTNPFSCNTTF